MRSSTACKLTVSSRASGQRENRLDRCTNSCRFCSRRLAAQIEDTCSLWVPRARSRVVIATDLVENDGRGEELTQTLGLQHRGFRALGRNTTPPKQHHPSDFGNDLLDVVGH